MISRWREFLDDAGAVIDAGGRVLHFGNPSRELRVVTRGSILVDLSHLGLIRAQGPDAVKFLQGQLTNDATRADAGLSQISGYCTPKGRLIALLRIFFRDQAYYLQLPSVLLEATLDRLRKYVLMSKIELVNDSDSLIGIGLSGPHCDQELKQVLETIPGANGETVQANALTVLRVPGLQPRFEIYGPVEAVQEIWGRLNVHAAPVGSGAWALLDILAGVPSIHPETVDEFVPQTLNLDLLGGISFSKGCYTGQEIVARLHYRGTVKRRMYLAHCESPEAPRAGEPIRAAAGGEQAVGQVVSAAPAPDGGYVLLASVMLEHAGASLRLRDPAGPELRLRDLPYLRAGAGD